MDYKFNDIRLSEKISEKYINKKDIPKGIDKEQYINAKVQAIIKDLKKQEYINYMKATKKQRQKDPMFGIDLASDSED